MEVQLESLPLAPLIEDVVKTLEPMAEKNANRLVIDCPSDIGALHADQIRVRQVLLNLASNANKFTESGTVTIAVAPRQREGRDWLEVAVTDTGNGVTEEQHGRLFQESSHAAATTPRYYAGAGLALAGGRR